ncbi:FmdE family protein [Mailhella sp.]|uniref:FmdE family protein n=1 Tax=Mailhella sp. TaxID=1981029 RepID=UPI0040629D8F
MFAPGITQDIIDKATAFHGHWCPGLARGIRAAVWAAEHFGTAADEEIVTVTETDMCGVDAIQALLGCTFGKGNLIFRDRGKVAFTFFRRSDGKSARIVENPRSPQEMRRSMELREALSDQTLPAAVRAELEREREELRQRDMDRLLTAPFDQLFRITEARCELPALAQRLPTLICEQCGEGVMSTRLCDVDGRKLCMDCAAHRR